MRLVSLMLFAILVQGQDLIVPGVGVGPVTRDSTEASLLAALGPDAVVADIDVGEGMFEQGLILYPQDPLHILAVTWNGQGQVRYVDICYGAKRGDRCAWHTREGVTLGTTLRELVRRNGREFRLVRWGTDVGGHVTSFAGGKLAGYTQERPGRFGIALDPPNDVRLTRQEDRSVYGTDLQVSSGLTAMRKLNPRVWAMGMWFSR